MKALIIGGGFGRLYKGLYEQHKHDAKILDPYAEGADFASVDSALEAQQHWDVVHICCPNFLHKEYAEQFMQNASIIFVEKPGFADPEAWQQVHKMGSARLVMVKNNLYREAVYSNISLPATIRWETENRVPGPGTWFTTKSKALGGVSQDILPHLLCMYIRVDPDWEASKIEAQGVAQNHALSQFVDTDYGTVDLDGVYDVDDECWIKMSNGSQIFANWKSDRPDDISISDSNGVIPLGLCPEQCYWDMIQDAYANLNNPQFWEEQLRMDIWIQTTAKNLSEHL